MERVRWFYRCLDEWSPFTDFENDELESAHRSGTNEVLFGGGKYTAFVTNRMQRNLDSGQERMLLRGTWYFQRPDGNLSPFPEDIADLIKVHFPADKPETSPPLNIGADGVITKCSDGTLTLTRHRSVTCLVTPAYEAGRLPTGKLSSASTALCASEVPTSDNGHAPAQVVWWRQLKDGRFAAYEAGESSMLEAKHRDGGGVVALSGGEQVDVSARMARPLNGGETTPVVRGTWYFQRTDGTLCPYPEDVGEQLETVFVSTPAEAEADKLLLKRTQALGRVLLPAHLGVDHESDKINSLTNALLEIGPHRSHEDNLVLLTGSAFGCSVRGMACAVASACSASSVSDASAMDRHRRRVRRVSARFGLPSGGEADVREDAACACLFQAIDLLMRLVGGDGLLADTSELACPADEFGRLLQEKWAKKNKKKGVGFRAGGGLVESKLLVKSADELSEAKEHWKGIQDMRDAMYEAEGAGELAVGGRALDSGDAGTEVAVGPFHYVTRAEAGGFVQVRMGTEKYRLVTRGYRPGSIQAPSKLRPLLPPQTTEENRNMPKKKAERDREAEVESSRACAAEAILLARSAPGGQACRGERVRVSNDALINHVKVGGGKPPLVLLQGYGAGAGLWVANLGDLASSFTVYAVDLPGAGLSSVPEFVPGDAGLRVEGGRLIMPGAKASGGGLLEAVKAEAYFVDRIEEWRENMVARGEPLETFRLAGFCFGGYIAACYAFKHPDRVSKLGLIEPWGLAEAPPGTAPPPTHWSYEVYLSLSLASRSNAGDSMAGQYRATIRDKFRLPCEGLTAPSQHDADSDSGTCWDEPVLVYLGHCFALQGTGSDAAFVSLCGGGDAGIVYPRRALVPRIVEQLPATIPVAVILAEETWVDARPAAELVSRLPHANLFVVPMSEHHVYIDNPAAFNETMAQKMR